MMGIIKTLVKIKFYLLSFTLGYLLHSCVYSDERYKIKRISNKPYLHDKAADRALRIYEGNFQVGSLEYRLLGIIEEKNLENKIEDLTNYEVIKDGK